MGKILLVLSMILLIGCRKDLCDLPHPHPHSRQITIAIDWKNAYDSIVPESVGVLFYPMEKTAEGEYVRKSVSTPITYYLPARGGNVNLNAGHYAAIAYNLDTEKILFRKKGEYNQMEAYTESMFRKSYNSRAEATGETTVEMPDLLYSDHIDLVEILPDEPGVLEQRVVFTPKPAVVRLHVNVLVNGMQYVASARGALSQMAGSYMLGLGGASSTPVTLFYDFRPKEGMAEALYAEVWTFGQLPAEMNRKQMLTIEFLLIDGSILPFTFDVTEDVIKLEHNITITLGINGEIEIPPVEGPGGGFDGGIGDWEEEIVVPLGDM